MEGMAQLAEKGGMKAVKIKWELEAKDVQERVPEEHRRPDDENVTKMVESDWWAMKICEEGKQKKGSTPPGNDPRGTVDGD